MANRSRVTFGEEWTSSTSARLRRRVAKGEYARRSFFRDKAEMKSGQPRGSLKTETIEWNDIILIVLGSVINGSGDMELWTKKPLAART